MDRIEDADDDIGIPKLAFIGSNEEKYLSNIYNGKISLKYAEFKQRDLEKKRGVTSIYSYKHIKQAYTALFHQKIESVQYNSALAITGAIRGTSKEKLYHELWKTLKKEDGTGNCAASLKYSETNLQNIYSILFLLL